MAVVASVEILAHRGFTEDLLEEVFFMTVVAGAKELEQIQAAR